MANLGTYNEAFNEIELAKTNKLRALHGAPPMVLDLEAAKSAQYWTEKMVTEDRMTHADSDARGGCGENLAKSSEADKMEKEGLAT